MMSLVVAISGFFNVLLLLGCWLLWKRLRAVESISAMTELQYREDIAKLRHAQEEAGKEYASFAKVVSNSIKEVREDINRNYCHVHDGGILDRLSYRIERTQRPVQLDDFLISEIRNAGGERFITGDTLLFSETLNFAWHVHEVARENAGDIFEVVKESCGTTSRSIWLSKTLALYERICGGDKNEAVRSLSLVIEDWKHTHVEDAVLAVR